MRTVTCDYFFRLIINVFRPRHQTGCIKTLLFSSSSPIEIFQINKINKYAYLIKSEPGIMTAPGCVLRVSTTSLTRNANCKLLNRRLVGSGLRLNCPE